MHLLLVFFYILYISERTEHRYTRFRFNTPHIIIIIGIYVFIGSRTIITIHIRVFFSSSLSPDLK